MGLRVARRIEGIGLSDGRDMSSRPKEKAVGSHGSWFARVRQESLPCIHKYWLKGMQYHDPNCVLGEKQWDEYVAAIREIKKVILTTDDIVGDRPNFQRTGYVTIFTVDEVTLEGRDLKLRLVDRLIDLE
jgi:hypothetical protein